MTDRRDGSFTTVFDVLISGGDIIDGSGNVGFHGAVGVDGETVVVLRGDVSHLEAARVIDATTESFVFEITGGSEKIDQFVNLMLPLGLVEVSRTGIVAISRGQQGMDPR